MRGCYLLCIQPPLIGANGRGKAGHYIGWAGNIKRRVKEHQEGKGARVTQVAVERGCKLIVAGVWPGEEFGYEKQLKRQHHHSRFCNRCIGERQKNRPPRSKHKRTSKYKPPKGAIK